GYLGEQFTKSGQKAVGVDPSPYMAELAKQRGVETIVGLFGKGSAQKILARYGQADLVIANNVFNHADNPVEFTNAVADILSVGGSFVFEQPYWLIGVESGKFDQIYHEHVSYFTVRSAAAVLARAGMVLTSAKVVDYHGGSLRIIAQKKEDAHGVSEEAQKRIREEEARGLFKLEIYKQFMRRNLLQRSRFLQKVHQIKEAGNSIIAVGAAAKGNTFLNFYKLDGSLIDYVTDSSPHKKGKYTPATRIPIVGDEIFLKYGKVYALILSWNIAPQLKETLSKFNKNIEFISPEVEKI
ncbi:MAG: class I SAM-dependent methyltransferase, partial [Nanoarchaeota archaeon]